MKNQILLILCGLLFFTFAGNTVLAGTIKINDSTIYPIEIAGDISYFLDPEGELGIDDIIGVEFISNPDDDLNLGYIDAHLWIKLNITNNTEEELEKLFLELDASVLDYVKASWKGHPLKFRSSEKHIPPCKKLSVFRGTLSSLELVLSPQSAPSRTRSVVNDDYILKSNRYDHLPVNTNT